MQFAQAPHFNHLNALYQNFDFQGPLDLVRNFAGLSDKIDAPAPKADAAASKADAPAQKAA